MHRESPFVTCPVYETRSFKLRLVRKEDAAGLLACYADKDAVISLGLRLCCLRRHFSRIFSDIPLMSFLLVSNRPF